jgi:thiamine biosynthesis lipoprotein
MNARAALAWLVFTGCAGDPGPTALLERSAGDYAMGTALEVTLLGPDVRDLEASIDDVFAEVSRIEALVSTWRPDSEVSRLNAAAGGDALDLDPEVTALLAHAAGLSRETRGSFDVTVGPLVALWKDAEAQGRPPAPGALGRARDRVGPEHLRIETTPRGARVALDAGSSLDLGGIAKGYALDRAREKLAPGIRAALLSFGQSSAWAIGHPPDARGWRLLARAPDGGFAGVLTLRDRALSVSGSFGQWREIAGRRYGHVLDPRSGQPLAAQRQALVVGDDATDAEALSKALLVLGPEEGIALVEAWSGAEALLLDADGRSWRTQGWNAVTEFEPTSSADTAPEPERPSSLRDGAPISLR